jgi:hypothetical protein
MGQMQLLLVVLGVLLVGIAIAVGVTMFQANAVESTRNAIINDLGFFAQRARAYYNRPSTSGGGNRSFAGLTLGALSSMTENANGRYYLESATEDECVIVGVGKIVSGDDSIRVRIRINERRNIIEIIN